MRKRKKKYQKPKVTPRQPDIIIGLRVTHNVNIPATIVPGDAHPYPKTKDAAVKFAKAYLRQISGQETPMEIEVTGFTKANSPDVEPE